MELLETPAKQWTRTLVCWLHGVKMLQFLRDELDGVVEKGREILGLEVLYWYSQMIFLADFDRVVSWELGDCDNRLFSRLITWIRLASSPLMSAPIFPM